MLDTRALSALRGALALLSPRGCGVPVHALCSLGGALPGHMGCTVDLAASRLLGVPVVVLRERRPLPGDALMARLSAREQQVARLAASGMRNREIGASLGISLATVKDHVHSVLGKTGLHSRAALAAALHHN